MRESPHRWRVETGVGLVLLACGQATSTGGNGQVGTGAAARVTSIIVVTLMLTTSFQSLGT